MNFKFHIISILGKKTFHSYLFWLKLTFIYSVKYVDFYLFKFKLAHTEKTYSYLFS